MERIVENIRIVNRIGGYGVVNGVDIWGVLCVYVKNGKQGQHKTC
jgi:hypothetical protein